MAIIKYIYSSLLAFIALYFSGLAFGAILRNDNNLPLKCNLDDSESIFMDCVAKGMIVNLMIFCCIIICMPIYSFANYWVEFSDSFKKKSGIVGGLVILLIANFGIGIVARFVILKMFILTNGIPFQICFMLGNGIVLLLIMTGFFFWNIKMMIIEHYEEKSDKKIIFDNLVVNSEELIIMDKQEDLESHRV
jgi:hypothetical protein